MIDMKDISISRKVILDGIDRMGRPCVPASLPAQRLVP
jgi:hypothetical protein